MEDPSVAAKSEIFAYLFHTELLEPRHVVREIVVRGILMETNPKSLAGSEVKLLRRWVAILVIIEGTRSGRRRHM